jgi:hypothetical protein
MRLIRRFYIYAVVPAVFIAAAAASGMTSASSKSTCSNTVCWDPSDPEICLFTEGYNCERGGNTCTDACCDVPCM